MSIEVHVRVRPGVANCVWSSAETVLYSTANPNTRYIYNKVHPNNSTNHTIFQGIEAIVHAAFDGKNVTVMAYGQTGSGKTHSMIGVQEDAGIVPRTARLLLELKKTTPGTVIQAYYTEIYNESVKDLLEPQRGELALHDAADGGVTFEKKTVSVETFDDFLQLQAVAERNRKYGVTNLNDHSSRSHMILTFEITRSNRGASKSVINLVDLAGSESAARANTEGVSLREGGFINKSLLTLGNVVDAIVEKRPYVPYRDAKLTRILRTCLGGSGITFILCCINPSRENYDQTVATLRFTQRAMKIKNDPVVVLNIPPLFTHQYSEGAKQLMDGLKESTDIEYQRGLRDTFMYCSSTTNSVVSTFEATVSDSMHALANAQRLLIAHDHATALDQVGRLYNQLNELTRQRVNNQELAENERKRQRDVVREIELRRSKLARLETELQEKATAADTELAGWEYQLHETRQKQVREVDVLLQEEMARRARIQYEWAVCMERIAARAVPAIRRLLPDEDGAHSDAVAAVLSQSGASNTKSAALKELRATLAKAQSEVADLELAVDMVRDDLDVARQPPPPAVPKPRSTSASTSPQPRPVDGDRIGSEADLVAYYHDVPEEELTEQIHQLEQEEKALLAQAKREVRRASLRRVRESLRGSPSRSPQAPSGGRPRPRGSPRDDSAPRGPGEDDHTQPFDEGRGSPATARGQRRTASLRSSKTPRHASPTAASSARARDSYADGVRNALSVLDGLKSRLLQQQQQQNQRTHRVGKRSLSAGSDGGRRDATNVYQDPADSTRVGAGGGVRRRRKADDAYDDNDDEDMTIVDWYYQQRGAPDERRRDGERDRSSSTSGMPGPRPRRGVGGDDDEDGGRGGKENIGGQRHGYGKHYPSPPLSSKYTIVAEDDEAFRSVEVSPGEVTPPPVGIAARRRIEQPQSRPAVERALWMMQSNSQSPVASMERRSRSRK